MKHIVGVMPLVDIQKESYWMLPGYMKGIEQAGGIPVMLPLTDDKEILSRLAESLDEFLFTGGQDVEPSVYNETKSENCGECSIKRDRMEKILFEMAYAKDKPVLGICRGVQFINAVMGGSLYQDLETEHPSTVNHHQLHPYDKPCHKVSIIKESPLYDLLKTQELGVNSLHHQAIKRLADGLSVMAVSEDGLTESVYAPQKKFIWGVQWHPEFSYAIDENSRLIFKKFVESM